MSIPHAFNPMGAAGGSWAPLDMSAFVSSTWEEGEILPLGRPYGGNIVTRGCTRSAQARVLYFGFDYRATLNRIYYNYGGISCPPRSSSSSAAPVFEVWNLGDPAKMRVTFTLSRVPNRASCTTDDWSTYKTNIPVSDNGDGTYTVTAPVCRALSVHDDNDVIGMNGKIVKIELWK